jgi:hypothetical protein
MKRVILLVSVLVMLFSIPCFGEEVKKNWELEYYKSQKQLYQSYITSNELLIQNSQLKIQLLRANVKEVDKKIKELQGNDKNKEEEKKSE